MQSEPTKQTETTEQLTKKIAKGGGIVFIGSIIGRILAFGLHILLGRVLGPASYGLYALGISTIGIARSIASLGLNRGIVRFGAAYAGEENKAKTKGTILGAMSISLIASIIAAFFLFLFAENIAVGLFHKPALTGVLKIFAIALPFYVLVMMASSVAQAFQRMEYNVLIRNIFRPITNLILVVLIFLLGYKLYGAIFGLILSAIFSAFLGLYLIKKMFPEILSQLKPSFEIKKLVTFSLPMIFVTLSYILALRTDRIMLGIFRPAEEVGIYNAAANIGMQLVMFHSALVAIFMPVISDVYNKENYGQMTRVYNIVKKWSSYGTLFLVLLVVSYSQLFMLIFGKAFLGAWSALTILAIGCIVGAICGPTGALLQMTGRQNIEFLNGALMVSANILLNYFLIPILGFLGAAIATVISAVIMNSVQVAEINYFFKFHPFNKKHLYLVGFAFVTIFFAVGINRFTAQFTKSFLFLLLILLFFIYVFINRTSEDKVVWKAIKGKFKRKALS